MKKSFKSYIVIWAIGLAIFNLCAFLIESETRFTPNFWLGYAFITLSFILQLGTAFFAFKEENLNKAFLNISNVVISFVTLVLTTIAAAITLVIGLPEWMGAILCFACFGIGVAATLLAKTTGDVVAAKDEKIKSQTFFIKALTVDVNTLVSQSQTAEIKAEISKVYESVRYSDPMSNKALASTESQISLKYNELKNAVASNDAQAVEVIADQMLVLLKDRNNKCKLLK